MRELVFGGIRFAWLFNLLKFYIGSCRIYERLLYKVELDEEHTLRMLFSLVSFFYTSCKCFVLFFFQDC